MKVCSNVGMAREFEVVLGASFQVGFDASEDKRKCLLMWESSGFEFVLGALFQVSFGPSRVN